MQAAKNVRLLLLLALGLLLVPTAEAQTTGNCATGVASADLDINNVRARLFNFGGLFWRGGDPIYEVPKGGDVQAIFASGIWVGGRVGGQLRMAAATYSNFEFWPGPLDESGNPPADCSQYDHIYLVSQEDVQNYEATGNATSDLQNWPAELGAPVVDGDGNPNNYNLAGGDRPEIIGNQTAWWVMNDVGGPHGSTNTPPIGLEVRVTAFAFRRADALNNTTFYRYNIIYKGDRPLTNAYMGLWSDPDLGGATDDFVGSDTSRGIGFVYNGGDFDSGYGSQPPALGYDFFQGPLVDNDGIDNDGDGEVDEEDERLQMSKFVYYNNDSTPQGNPDNAQEYYQYLQGIWRDGEPITFGGTGRGFTNIPADYMFPGDPAQREYWSEENVDGNGSRNSPSDRRFLMSAGPFTIQPGDQQEIVFGIVWAQGADRLASVTAMKNADQLAQAAFDVDFQLPAPPAAPRVNAGTFDRTVTLTWGYEPGDNNYLDRYNVTNPFIVGQEGIEDTTYTFEGYKIFRYSSPSDQEGQLVATYDVENGVTVVTDDAFDPQTGAPITVVTAQGTDSGVRHSISFQNLTNYQDYYFGVQAYAYNEHSAPKVLEGPVNRVTVRPSRVNARAGGTQVAQDSLEVDIAGQGSDANRGDGSFGATIVNPTALTGDTYRVEFYALTDTSDAEHPVEITTYDLVNETTGEVLLDGQAYFERTGNALPQGASVTVADGLSFDIQGPAPGMLTIDGDPAFVEVQAPGGGDPCEGSTAFGCAEVGGDYLSFSLNSTGDYFRYHISAGSEETIGAYTPNEYEIRFVPPEEGSYVYHAFTTGNAVQWPIQVWDIGIVSPGTENDPSDDVRMIPAIFSDSGGECELNFGEGEVSGYPATDRIYAYYPVEGSTYEDWHTYAQNAVGDGCAVPAEGDAGLIDYDRGRPLQREVMGILEPGAFTVPQMEGAIIRYYTVNPNLPGDAFTLDTEGLGVEDDRFADNEFTEEALDNIGIVPNPYKGASAYEVTNLQDVARFTNLPYRATIRVFTLDGTLIRTLEKEGPGNSLDWDLQTRDNLPIASGIYLIHVTAFSEAGSEIGEKVIKFAVVKKRIQLDVL